MLTRRGHLTHELLIECPEYPEHFSNTFTASLRGHAILDALRPICCRQLKPGVEAWEEDWRQIALRS